MPIPIYSKYASIKEATSQPEPSAAHGMSGSQIDQLHDRFSAFMPSITKTANSSSSFRSMFEGNLPEGASWSPAKVGQMSPMQGPGSGGGRQLTTVQQPYQPEFASPDRQQYPVHRILANRYWRLFYKLDPVIGNCIDLFADLPWSNFELTGEGIEGDIRQSYEYMCRETQILAMLPHFVREFLVVGEAVPHTFFDEDKGVFTYVALHNPDQLEVIDAPFIKMDPILEFVPDDRLRSILTSDLPALRKIRERMPPELLNRLNAKQNIPLSSLNATFIPRKLHPYDARGTSIISRMWRVLMLEDAVFNAQIQIARRAAYPLKIAKLGNAQTGWIPPPEQEKRLLELLAQAELDPNAWLVYHYGITFETIGTSDKGLTVNREWDTIERIKLVALGISKSFLHGEVSYACLPAGTAIATPNGPVEIQNMQVGDAIIDKDGKTQAVEAAWCEGVPDKLIEIKLWGGKIIQSTVNHNWPVWSWLKKCACGCGETLTVPGKCFKQFHHSRVGGRFNTINLKYVDGEVAFGGKPRQIPESYEPMQKLRADELRAGDYLLIPRKFDVCNPHITLEQARLLGYYIAEGNLCKNKSKTAYVDTRWTMNINEYDTWIADIRGCCNTLNINTNSNKNAVRNTSTITTSGNAAHAFTTWINRHAGHYALNKTLSTEVMSWPVKHKVELIRGMFRGDGSQSFSKCKNRLGTKYQRFVVQYTTISETLANQTQAILAQLGYYAAINTEEPRVGSDGSPRHKLFILAVYGSHARRLANLVWGDLDKSKDVVPGNRVRDRYRVDDDYIYVPIKSVKLVDNIKPVYNLTVSDSHSYLANGIGTYNSSATGLQVFLQRLKSLRMFFEQKWLYPKFFRPIAEINGWIKPKPQEVNHRYRVKRSARELEEQNAYIIPKIVWDKSLDPQINSELINAINTLEQIGVKFSKTTKMAAVGYSFEEETKKIQREQEFEKQFMPALPQMPAPAGGGGGLGGGGAPPPGGAPGDGDAQTPPGLDGQVPPGVNAPPAPPTPGGAGVEVGADEGKSVTDSTKPKGQKSGNDNLKSDIWVDEMFGNWNADEVADLVSLIETGETSSAFWHQLALDSDFRHAAAYQDMAEMWNAMDTYLISQGYPEKDIKELKYILEKESILIPQEVSQLLDGVEQGLPDNADSLSDIQFADVVSKLIAKNKNKITTDSSNFLTGVSSPDTSGLMGDISGIMPTKSKGKK